MGLALHPWEERLSRFLAFVLRHRPDRIGLTLEPGGWVRLDDLLEALTEAWKKDPVDAAVVGRIVELDPKGRYELDGRGGARRIRARYGHSVAIGFEYSPVQPPEVLLHGTARKFLSRIRALGLEARGRQFVHLTDDFATALEVGGRRDSDPVVLRIDAASMAREGHEFFEAGRHLFLVRQVPAKYLLDD